MSGATGPTGPSGTASAQEVRAVLAKWTANDWRRAFALADELEAAVRRTCEVPEHEPILDNAGAVAMPVRTRLERLELAELRQALAPLAIALEDGLSEQDLGPGLVALAGCGLAAGLDGQPPVLEAARRVLEGVRAGRAVHEQDLALLQGWNEELAGTAPLSRALQELAAARLDGGARAALGSALEEAAKAVADPGRLTAERRAALVALHRLLSQASWQVSDADVEVVEAAFGRKAARVAVAEVAL